MVKTIQKVQLLHYCQNWCVSQSVLLKTTDINKKSGWQRSITVSFDVQKAELFDHAHIRSPLDDILTLLHLKYEMLWDCEMCKIR